MMSLLVMNGLQGTDPDALERARPMAHPPRRCDGGSGTPGGGDDTTLRGRPRGLAGGTFDPPTFWYELERFVFARSKPDWLAIPPGIEVCQAMPER
jgi:hypothetical protein